jgi:membrane protein
VYYALVSLVPLLLLLLAALGLALHISDAASAAEKIVLDAVQTNFGIELRKTLEHLLTRLREDSFVVVSISLVGLLLTASALFKHLRLTFRAVWKQAPPLASGRVRVFLQATFMERMVAFLMVLAGGALLLATFAAMAVLQWIAAAAAGLPVLGEHLGWLLALAGALLVAPLTFALLLRFLPPVQLRWRDVALASIICGGVWLLGAEIFTIYAALFAPTQSAYGALGAVLVVMLWMNIVSQVLFFGAELSKVVFWSHQEELPGATPRA